MLYFLLFILGIIAGVIVLAICSCVYVGAKAEKVFYESYKKIEDNIENK